MDIIAHPTNTEPSRNPICVDTVAATAAGFLRTLGLDRDQLNQPWITITALSVGAWIDVSPPFGTATERLDLIGEAAKALGADDTAVRYQPSGSATFSNVVVTGEWAECPITVRTSIATTDLVDVEMDRAVEATLGDLIEGVAGHYPAEKFGAEFQSWLEQERKVEEADDAWADRVGDARERNSL